MSIIRIVSTVFLTCLLVLVAPNSAFGQQRQLGHGTGQSFDSEGRLRQTSWVNGSNAVATDMTVSIDTTYDPFGQRFYITANVSINGDWRDPNTVTPDMRYQIDHGMQQHATYNFIQFDWDGVDFAFSSPVSLELDASFSLDRYFDDDDCTWNLWGYGNASSSGRGLVAVSNTAHLWTIEDNLGSVVRTGWNYLNTTRYQVVAGISPIPNPGAATILGLTGFVAMLRRR